MRRLSCVFLYSPPVPSSSVIMLPRARALPRVLAAAWRCTRRGLLPLLLASASLTACNDGTTAPVAPPAPAGTLVSMVRSSSVGGDAALGSLLIQITGRIDSLVPLQQGVRTWRLPDEPDHFLVVGPIESTTPLLKLQVPGQTALGYRVRVLQAATRTFAPLDSAAVPTARLQP